MMFVAIVSTGLFLFNKGKSVAEVGGGQLDTVSEQLALSKYQSYDNKRGFRKHADQHDQGV